MDGPLSEDGDVNISDNNSKYEIDPPGLSVCEEVQEECIHSHRDYFEGDGSEYGAILFIRVFQEL